MTAPIAPSQGGHTPTPWFAEKARTLIHIGPKDRSVVSLSISPPRIPERDMRDNIVATAEANAAFIVEACNSHATLKARIEELESETARLSALWIGETRRVEELEAALKTALGVIEQEELHGFGAHDSSCSLCRSVKDARTALASGGASSPEGK